MYILNLIQKVFLSTRRGSWIVNRISKRGMPADMIGSRRIMMKIRDILQDSMINYLIQRELNSRFDHDAYGLKPNHGVFAQHPTVNDDTCVPNRIASGTKRVKPNVKTFTENGLIFEDSTKEENIDVVVLAGYKFGFPFRDKSVIDVKQNRVELF